MMPNAGATILRVRQVVDEAEDADLDFLDVISRDELVDMVLCATSFIHGMKTFLTVLGMDGDEIIAGIFKGINTETMERGDEG